MDYSKITADIVRGPEIGRMYVDASPFVTSLAKVAYRQLADQVERQFRELPVKVEFVDDDPYLGQPDAHLIMFDDIGHGSFKVWATQKDQRHPLLGCHGNDMFRAVHDFHGHYMTHRDFSRHGEEAAWVRHSQMFTGLARRAMTTETRGQNSAFIWVNGGRQFPEQKAILLPDWVSEVPYQWR